MIRWIPFFLAGVSCAGGGEPTRVEPVATPVYATLGISFRPSLDALPENGLTVRITFPQSVQIGGQSLRIQDETGVKIPDAIHHWAWDEPRRTVRLTPTGLSTGTRFWLSVAGLVYDDGTVLPSFSKSYVVREADHTPPDGALVVLLAGPKTGHGQSPLELVFNEPIRWSSLGALSVLSGAEPVLGVWSLGPHQTRARFLPDAPWAEAKLFVPIGAGVTDLAGNQMTPLSDPMLSLDRR